MIKLILDKETLNIYFQILLVTNQYLLDHHLEVAMKNMK